MPSLKSKSSDINSRNTALLKNLVDRIGTTLSNPESYVVTQDDDYHIKETKIFYVGKGKCFVNVRDESGHEHEGIRTLAEGDHFGEVSMIYKTKRTASVLCANYNTFALL